MSRNSHEEIRPAVQASAPGKLVVSGEYAVLCGAPALVAAVDRRVRVRLRFPDSGSWRIESFGAASDVEAKREDAYAADAADMLMLIARFLPRSVAPEHLVVEIDSRACFHDGLKLGIGSSAAMVTALATALGSITGASPELDALIDAHQALQGGGSGLDVAASQRGGVIRFANRTATPVTLPEGLHHAFVFVGSSTRTLDLVARFERWRAGGEPPELRVLIESAGQAAEAAANCTKNAQLFIDALRQYADALERMDSKAMIGIFGDGHRTVREIAHRRDVLYKPCGAGGGDCGIALSNRRDALDAFEDDLRKTTFTLVPMEITNHGATR